MSTVVDDALVLLDLEGASYFALNDPAADVWEAAAEPMSQAHLVDQRVIKCTVAPADCALSVKRVLDDFAGKGLARRAD